MTNLSVSAAETKSIFVEVFEDKACFKRISELNNEQKLIVKNFVLDSVRIKLKLDKDSVEKSRSTLLAQFPNFQQVTNRIFDNLLLTTISKTKGVKFRPLLMVGEPGIGKTYYTTALTKQLGLPSIGIDFATTSAGFVLTGMSSKWGNASVGHIAKLLMTQKICNGIIILDEIDKTQSRVSNNASDPLLALLSLLEQHSAETFRDEFLEFTLDTTELNYIATANNISELPIYILSRFDVCHVTTLDDKQIRAVAKMTYSNLLTEFEIEDDFSTTLSKSAIDEICNVGDVRRLKKIITNAMIRAVREDRRRVSQQDVIDSVAEANESLPVKSSIGFIH